MVETPETYVHGDMTIKKGEEIREDKEDSQD